MQSATRWLDLHTLVDDGVLVLILKYVLLDAPPCFIEVADYLASGSMEGSR